VELTRRDFLEAAGAGALAATAAPGRFARRPDGPNVLVLIVDTLRADHVGAYGGRARTPNMDALAREGLRFTRFFPEAMATVPARRSIMTGRRIFPFRHWEPRRGLMSTPGWAPIADVDATFTSALQRAGWWTAYVTDNPFLGFSSAYAPFRRSFHRFERVGGQVGRTRPSASVSHRELDHWLVPELRQPHIERRVRAFLAAGGGYWRDERLSWAARVYTRAARVLAGAVARRRPFALVVDTFEPHEPWTPPRAYIDLYGDPDQRGPEPCMARYSRVSDYLKPARRGAVLGRMRDLYAAELTMTDRWMGLLLDWLEGLGVAGETIVLLVGDHGYLLGEHGWTGKIASMLHPPLIRVPFVLRDPGGRRAGRSSDWLAQTHDIGPTVLDMTGVRRPEAMNGTSLAPLLRGKRPRERRPMALGGYANWHYARTDRWAFVAANTGRGRRLYDVRRDPDERHNVARRHPKLIDELERRVRREAGDRLPVYE
jgi:arylsulfatase A-like enzyme